jgi:hypothetical protein
VPVEVDLVLLGHHRKVEKGRDLPLAKGFIHHLRELDHLEKLIQ